MILAVSVLICFQWIDGGLPPNTWAFEEQTSNNKQAVIKNLFMKGRYGGKNFIGFVTFNKELKTRQNTPVMKVSALLFTICLNIGLFAQKQWPVLKHYEDRFIEKIAMPVGGIGTGNISIGGNGQWKDV